MKAGSVLVYFGGLLHAGGANISDRPRTGLVISYNLGWLRQAENQYLATSLETARALPERLQKLLGYFVHEPNLGCVETRPHVLAKESGKWRSGIVPGVYTGGVPACLKEFRESQIKAA